MRHRSLALLASLPTLMAPHIEAVLPRGYKHPPVGTPYFVVTNPSDEEAGRRLSAEIERHIGEQCGDRKALR